MIPLSLSSSSSSSSTESTEIDSFLRSHYGLNKLKIDWLNRCMFDLNISIPGFVNLSVADRGDHIYQKFLDSDIKSSSDGVLPNNISSLCENDLPGPFILRVDNIVNRSPHPQRSFMLYMTDGVQHVVGWEIRPIQAIGDLAPCMKVRISNVTVQSGILMLAPEGIDVLRKAKHKTSVVEEEGEANQPRSVKSGDNSHGSTKDEVIPLGYLNGWCSDWFNRNNTPTIYKFKCVVSALGELYFENRTTYRCLVDVYDGSSWALVCIPHEIVEKKIGRSAQEVCDAFHSGPELYDKILDKLKHEFCSFQCTMVVEMRDSSIPVALEINDVKPLLGPLHTVPGSQQETEIPNGASNVEPRVAAELDKISVVGCTGAMSEMDIREEKFAGCSNAVPDSGVNSHGSTKDKEMIPLEYLDSMFSVWENRNDNTPIQYKIKCVVYDIAEMWFKKWETYECLVNVTDGSRESMVLIPLEGTMLLEMNENSSVPVNLELNDEKTSFDFRWFKVHRGF